MSRLGSVIVSLALAVVVFAACGVLSQTSAQQVQYNTYQDLKREANENVVTIMASDRASPYTIFAEDIRNVLDQPDTPGGLRVLPMLGRGGKNNAIDVLLLKGVDMGVVDQDLLRTAKATDPVVFANMDQRLHYITKLANSEIQFLGLNSIKSLRDLEGKKVNFFKKGSATDGAAATIFKLLNVHPIEVHLDQAAANEALRKGEIAAMLRFAGAPHNAFVGFKASEGVHFIPIDAETLGPTDFAKLLDIYSPALLKHSHYPNVIPENQPVPTITSGMLLVVYNWPPNTERYVRLTNFVNQFFDNIDKFDNPARHPKWKEINIAADVRGWHRFKPAQDWLDAHRKEEKNATAEVRVAFGDFLKQQGNSKLTPQDRELLFSQFMQWWSAKKTSQR